LAAPTRHDGLPIADPLQVLWDVRRVPGPDSGEAGARLWQRIVRWHRRIVHSAAQPI
jgi:hypothetical protein